jgi:hypothetical protein
MFNLFDKERKEHKQRVQITDDVDSHFSNQFLIQ